MKDQTKSRGMNKETQRCSSHIKTASMVILKCFIGLLLLCSVSSLTGCLNPLVRHWAKDSPGTYSELKAPMPAVPPGSGRLFVYIVGKGSPAGVFGVGDMSICTVDKRLYRIMGDTYWYVDLQVGTHKVTADKVFDTDWWTGKVIGHDGKHSVNFDLKEGESKYCRIVLGGFGAWTTFTPTMVEPTIAEQDLANLDFYKKFEFRQPYIWKDIKNQ